MPAQPILSVRPTVEIDGTPQPLLADALISAKLEQGLDHAAEAMLVFTMPTPLGEAPAAAVIETARPGRLLRFGLDTGSPALFAGEIVAVTQDLRGDRPPRLEIVAQDRLADLERTTLTTAYLDRTPLGVIQAVADRHQLQLTGDVSDGPPRETTVQAGESDLALIRRLALELDAAVVADGTGLRLLRRSTAGAPLHRLVLGETLRALRFTADATALPERLTVQGWDPGTQETLIANRATPTVFSPPLQTPARGEDLVADAALTRAAAVTTRLQALLATRMRRPVTATGTCAGAVPLQPGHRAAMAGVGPWASGTYTIEAVSHVFSLEEGWQTAFFASLPPPDPVRPDPVRREAPNADRDTRNPPRPDVVRQPAVPTGRPSPSRRAPPRRPGR